MFTPHQTVHAVPVQGGTTRRAPVDLDWIQTASVFQQPDHVSRLTAVNTLSCPLDRRISCRGAMIQRSFDAGELRHRRHSQQPVHEIAVVPGQARHTVDVNRLILDRAPSRWTTRCRALAALLTMLCGPWTCPALATEGPDWFAGAQATPAVQQAIDLLAAAPSHGLDPRDYGVEDLRSAAARVAASSDAAARDRLSVALTAAMERYLSDLRRGRVDPRRIHHDFSPPAHDGFDAADVLRDALQHQRLVEAVRDAAPRLSQYQQLRAALARLSAMQGHAVWSQPLPPLPLDARHRKIPLEPGQPWAGVVLLAQRLSAWGDMAAEAPAPPAYDGALVDAVRSFQRRHALTDDGVIGPATLAALQVTPAQRMRQVVLSLERLRWTPLLQAPRMVVINIPEFVLRAYEVRDGRIEVRQTMKVIVGKAMRTRTPLFDEAMRFIEFSPYWNVPDSIARGEIVPRLRRDPGYWNVEGFEFVDAAGHVSTVLDAAALDAVRAGRQRIRQRPGPRNALGDIKFVFPNREHIYLHHTPSVRLFEHERRDFSHGCIRVEQPVALAGFVLQDMPQWTEARVREAMRSGKSFTLRLAEPVPVLIAYATALVRGGRMHFYDDLYGLDQQLDIALRDASRRAQQSHRP
jgi:L,D-transpeptidase YcbB